MGKALEHHAHEEGTDLVMRDRRHGFKPIRSFSAPNWADCITRACGKVLPITAWLTWSWQIRTGFAVPKESSMKTLRDLVKDRKLYSVEATRTVLEAARFMMEHNIGALPVLHATSWRASCRSATS